MKNKFTYAYMWSSKWRAVNSIELAMSLACDASSYDARDPRILVVKNNTKAIREYRRMNGKWTLASTESFKVKALQATGGIYYERVQETSITIDPHFTLGAASILSKRAATQ